MSEFCLEALNKRQIVKAFSPTTNIKPYTKPKPLSNNNPAQRINAILPNENGAMLKEAVRGANIKAPHPKNY